MKIGQKVYVIGYMNRIEEATIQSKEKDGWGVKHRIGSNKMPEELLFNTVKEAEDALSKLLEKELIKFKETNDTMEKIIRTLYSNYCFEENNGLVTEYLRGMIKEHMGIDIGGE